MKAQILKIAGVKSEKEFYKKFPTEEAFMKKHGKEMNKLEKAQRGKNVDPILFEDIEKEALSQFEPIKDQAMNYGIDSLTTDDEKEAAYMNQLKQAALLKDIEGGSSGMSFGDIGGMIKGVSGMFGGGAEGAGGGEGMGEGASEMMSGMGGMMKKGGKVEKFTPHMMYDPKTKKGKKAKTLKEHLALKKKGWGHDTPKAQFDGSYFEDQGITVPEQSQYGNADGAGMFGKSFSTGQYNEDGSAMNFGQKIGDFVQNDLGAIMQSPITKDIMQGLGKIKGQKDALKDLRQMEAVTDIALTAAMSEPEKVERDYVRPEDFVNTGEEFFPVYGVGTNVLAKNGATLFNNPDYAPIRNVNKAKTFMHGGYLPQAQDGGIGGSNVSYDQAGNFLGNLAYGNKSQRDAGSNIGGGVGRGIGTLVGGPLGGAIGDFIGSGIGDLVDRNDRRQRITRENIDSNVKDMTYMQVGPQIQAGYASHVRKGGRVPSPNNDYGMIGAPGPQVLKSFDGKNLNNMLQKASRMPDTLKQGGSVSGNGNIKTLWGGDVNAVSYNPYAGGQSMYFSGNSHDYRDPETGETGIGVAYGPQSVANNEAVVEVENEPAQILEENGKENLVIYGDLKIPKGYASEIGDEKAGGQKFKNYVNNLNDEEAKINKQMGTAVDNAADIDNTKWGELLRSTSDAIINGGDMKLKNIANKKKILSDLQTALNDTFEENGIEGNKFITKGVLEDIKDTEDYAKNGKKETYTKYAKGGRKIPKAQNDGSLGPDEGLTLNELPFKSAEEAIAAGYTLDEDKNSENFGKYYIDEESSDMETNTEVSFREDIPEGQKFGGSDIGKMVNKEITSEEYNKWKKDNKWFFDKNPDWKADTKEDVKLFQREFNKVNPNNLPSIKVDGLFGDQTISARFKSEDSETPKTERRYRDVEVGEEEITTEETTTVKGKIPFDPNLLRPLFDRDVKNDLDYNQILPEINAAANNQLDPVYAQSFQPRLRVPYDISMQDEMNAITSATRAATQNPIVQSNPALLAAMQAPQYEAINQVKAKQFRANQQMKDTVYSGNLETLNQARMTNLGIYDQQQTRQTQAVANTKATQQEIVKSISDKYQRNKLENRTEKVLSNLFPNYNFSDSLDLNNQGSTNFSIPNILGGQAGNTGNGLSSILNVVGLQGLQQLMQTPGFNPDPNQTTTDTTTARHGAKLTPIKRKVKKNQRNSNILREYKNL